METENMGLFSGMLPWRNSAFHDLIAGRGSEFTHELENSLSVSTIRSKKMST